MSKIKILEDSVFDWLSEFGTVVFANQSLGIQDYPFVVCKISGFEKKGFDENIYNLKEDELITNGLRQCKISIDIFDKENGNANEIGLNIINSIELRKTLNHFRKSNIVLKSDAKLIDLTQLIKTTFEQRAHIDLTANFTSEVKEIIETINLNDINITGDLKWVFQLTMQLR